MEAPAGDEMRSLLLIDGMRTVHCVRAVFQALAGVPGISRAEVSIGRAEVEHETQLREQQLSESLEPLGFRIRGVQDLSRHLTTIGDDQT